MVFLLRSISVQQIRNAGDGFKVLVVVGNGMFVFRENNL